MDGRNSAAGENSRRRRVQVEAGAARPGLVAELWEFLATNKKWWLAPIVVLLLLVGALLVLTATPVAPFIYTLF